MTTTFPGAVDDFTARLPTPTSPRNNPSLAQNIVDLMDALTAVQTFVKAAQKDLTEAYFYNSAAGSTEALDCNTYSVFDLLLDQACTISITNPPASGVSQTIVVCIRNGASAYAVTWPAAVKWAGGTTPTLSGINKADLFGLTTFDGGTTWAGYATQNFASLGHG